MEVLNPLPGEEFKLVAEDSVDCVPSLLQKVKTKLSKFSENCMQTVGLENIIRAKIGYKLCYAATLMLLSVETMVLSV